MVYPKTPSGRKNFSPRQNMENVSCAPSGLYTLTVRGTVDVLSLTMLFAAQLLPHVFSERIQVLPLFVGVLMYALHGPHFAIVDPLLVLDVHHRDHFLRGHFSRPTCRIL